MDDRRVVQCNYREGTHVVAAGARAYLQATNAGNGHDRVCVLVRSRGGRWVRIWEDTRRLRDFRVKTLPPQHPRYGEELWDAGTAGSDALIECLNGVGS